MSKRFINEIIIHCSASDETHHDDISVIRKWHLDRGWRDVGYHYYIKKGGTVQEGRPHWQMGAHTSGYNDFSLGICLGGEYKFTKAQYDSLEFLVRDLIKRYPTIIKVSPHNRYTNKKTCPNFTVAQYDSIILGDRLCQIKRNFPN